MNWKSIFKTSEILTASDRLELEKIEDSTKQLRELAARIDRDWPDAPSRISKIRDLAAELCLRPTDPELYRRMETAACMPSVPASGYQHREAALGVIGEAIETKLEPSIAIVRRVLARALEQAEAELKRTEAKERKTAEDEGYGYSPTGRILALQARVLDLRNAVAAKYRHEGAVQNPGDWRVRLSEWL